jgi:hypothetical protein
LIPCIEASRETREFNSNAVTQANQFPCSRRTALFEHPLDVFPISRLLISLKDLELMRCNLVPLVPVFFSEIGFHVPDEGLRNARRKIAGLADHVLSSSTKPGGRCQSGGN